MIQLACNYLSETIELIREQSIHLDYLKYPSIAGDAGFNSKEILYQRFDEMKIHRPILYHGNFPCDVYIGHKSFIKSFDLDAFRDVVEMTKTPGISLHFTGGEVGYTKDETVEIAVKNICFIKNNFPDMDFITIENSPSARNKYELDPEVISEIVEKVDIHFLYDISHAFKCSFDQGRDFLEYVSKLPLHKLYEMHMNGWVIKGDDVQAHMCIQDVLYEHIEDVVKNYPVKIITLEYGRHNDRINSGCPVVAIGTVNQLAKEELKTQLNKLREIIDRNQ